MSGPDIRRRNLQTLIVLTWNEHVPDQVNGQLRLDIHSLDNPTLAKG